MVLRLEGALNEQDDGVKVTQTLQQGGGVLGRALNALVLERMNARNA